MSQRWSMSKSLNNIKNEKYHRTLQLPYKKLPLFSKIIEQLPQNSHFIHQVNSLDENVLFASANSSFCVCRKSSSSLTWVQRIKSGLSLFHFRIIARLKLFHVRTTCTCSSSTPYLSRTTYIYLRNTCGAQYRVHYRLSNTFLFHPPFISRIHYNLINYSNLESTLSLSLESFLHHYDDTCFQLWFYIHTSQSKNSLMETPPYVTKNIQLAHPFIHINVQFSPGG